MYAIPASNMTLGLDSPPLNHLAAIGRLPHVGPQGRELVRCDEREDAMRLLHALIDHLDDVRRAAHLRAQLVEPHGISAPWR